VPTSALPIKPVHALPQEEIRGGEQQKVATGEKLLVGARRRRQCAHTGGEGNGDAEG